MNNQKAPKLVTSRNYKGDGYELNSVREIYFLLCNSCYWCASYLSKSRITNCPLCEMTTLESMPVSSNEEYRIDYNHKQGIVLEFKKIPAIA